MLQQWDRRHWRIGTALALVLALQACQQGGGLGEVDKATVGAVVGGVAGGLLGAQIGESNTVRLIAGVAGAAVGAWVGYQIGGYLDAQDQKRAAEAAQTAAVTGQTQTWRNPDADVSGRAEVVDNSTRQETVQMPVAKQNVALIPPIELIGAPYRATGATVNVRSGPATDYKTVGQLSRGQQVQVAGKVTDQPWYLISQGGVVTGYVHTSLLEPVSVDDIDTKTASAKPEGEVIQAPVSSTKKCRTIRQIVKLPDGSTKEEDLFVCQSPDGWVAA